MRPFYCTDITNDKKNKDYNGKEFITATVPKEAQDEFDKKSDEQLKEINKLNMDLIPHLIKSLCLMVGSMITFAALIRGFRIGFAELFAEQTWLPIVGVLALIVGVLAHLIEKKIKGSAIGGKTMEDIDAEFDRLADELYAALGVPSYAEKTDIFVFSYKTKDGATVPEEFFNLDFMTYEDGGALHLSDSESIYSFKIENMKQIRAVNETVPIACWNKKDEPTDPKYEKYITRSKKHLYGTTDKYYILEVENEGEISEIYFPSYELPVFERLTGVTYVSQG